MSMAQRVKNALGTARHDGLGEGGRGPDHPLARVPPPTRACPDAGHSGRTPPGAMRAMAIRDAARPKVRWDHRVAFYALD